MGSAIQVDGIADPVVEGFVRLSPDPALVVDRHGVIRAANSLAAELFRVPLAELVGASVDRFVPTDARVRHAGLRAGYVARPRHRLIGADLDLRAVRADGTEFPADASLAPMGSDGPAELVVVTVRDVTDLRNAEREVSRLAAVVRASDSAILSVTTELLIDSWNPAAVRTLGYAPGDVLGQPLRRLVPDDLHDQMVDMYERVSRGERIGVVDTWRINVDGVRLPVAVSVSGMWDRHGELVGFCEVLRDITEPLRVQAELAAAQADRQILADRERIARDMHDVVIQRIFATGLSVQGVAATVEPLDVRERLMRAVSDLDDTVRDIRTSIFTLRRPEDDGSLRGRLSDLASSVTAALGFRPAVRFDGRIELGISAQLAEDVLATAREGLANVAKHAQATAAHVEVRTDGQMLEVEVVDNGRGLGDSTRRSGLANLAARAARVGGAFRVESRSGDGTRLLWRVPLGTQTDAAVQPPTGRRGSVGRRRGSAGDAGVQVGADGERHR